MNDKLLVLGTMAYDAIESPFGKTGKILGGCATYIGLAASKFKTSCGLVSIIGGDFKKSHLKLLKSSGLDLSGVDCLSGEKTFFWSGKYHNDLNLRTTIDTQLNVLKKFKPKVPDNFKDSSIVLLGNLDPNLQGEVLNQMRNPSLIIMDTMNFWIDSYRDKLDEVISKVDVFSLNDEEARQITRTHSLVEAAQKLHTMGPSYVIIKKGEHGAVLVHADGIAALPAFPLEEEQVVDPTGAGDSFAGGFMGYVAAKGTMDFSTMQTGIAWGTVTASFTLGSFGLDGLVATSREALETRMQEFRQIARI